jgi:1-deoxy-D-xylulose-5-phosphate reductoisomerase
MSANSQPQQIAVFGSTGSIGTSALEVIGASDGRLNLLALSAHTRLETALDQARRFHPKYLVATCEETAQHFDASQLPAGTQFLVGHPALQRVVADPALDTVVAAIVGSAGLHSTWAALEAGKRVALANKETLVVAGPQVRALIHRTRAELLPVDSEHSAIFQALRAGRREDVSRVILTSSGGPFRDFSDQQLAQVTLQQALAHPTWEMGRKITIDSATMMNKALEIVEARWLFDLRPEQIEVVIHPQSVVHSLVEFRDGSMIAQMSPPDMRMPIQLALSYPERWPCPAPKLDFTRPTKLEFQPPDPERFPAIALGMEVARLGGSAGAVVNAANEAAVQGFMDGQVAFIEIVPICQRVLQEHTFEPHPSIEQVLQLDAWARREVTKWVCT